jgi:hypothetical protein
VGTWVFFVVYSPDADGTSTSEGSPSSILEIVLKLILYLYYLFRFSRFDLKCLNSSALKLNYLKLGVRIVLGCVRCKVPDHTVSDGGTAGSKNES